MRAIVYKAAVRRRYGIHLNRYPGVVIGVAVHIGRWCLSIVWRMP